jgi:hypothetical protein
MFIHQKMYDRLWAQTSPSGLTLDRPQFAHLSQSVFD